MEQAVDQTHFSGGRKKQSGSKSKSLVISSQFLRFMFMIDGHACYCTRGGTMMVMLLHFVKSTRILGTDGIVAKLYTQCFEDSSSR